MHSITKHALAAGLAGALAFAVAPVNAAPVLSNTSTLKTLAPDHVTDVQWRGRRGAIIGAGIVAGAIIGGAIASRQHHYYGPGPAYGYYPGPVVEGPVYYDAPVYAEPAPMYAPPARCWVATDRDRGFGYWGAC